MEIEDPMGVVGGVEEVPEKHSRQYCPILLSENRVWYNYFLRHNETTSLHVLVDYYALITTI